MTDELLQQANNLKSRIRAINKLLENIDLTDTSDIDPTPRISPIMVQAGMAQTIQFDVVHKDEPHPTEIQLLDSEIHKMLVTILTDYKKRLEEYFDNLA